MTLPRSSTHYSAALKSLEDKVQVSGLELVLPEALIQRKMCIVAESLGSDEVSKKRYFSGKAGYLFDKTLREVGLIRSALHVTNVIKVQPPGNKVSRLKEVGLCREDFIPLLAKELAIVKPQIILAVGRHAMEVLTAVTGVLKWRGSIVPSTLVKDVPTVITLHPSYLQRGQMHLYPYVRNDYKVFAERAFGIREAAVPHTRHINPTATEALQFLAQINGESVATSFDIETVGAQKITCIGWTLNENEAMCIPFRHQGLKNRWYKHEQIMLLHAMSQIYTNPKITKIGQNIHYDMHFLLPLLGFPREPIFDTMYAHTLIHPDARHDLGFIMSVYTDMNYHKDDVKDWSAKDLPHDQVLWTYNADDCVGTHRAAIGLKKDLIDYEMWDFFTGYAMPLRRVLFEMEHRGLRVDTTLRSEWSKFVEEEELPIALEILEKLVGEPMNPNSSKQVGEWLAARGINVRRTDKGNYTVKEDEIDAIRARHPKHREVLDQIICTRVLKAKDLGTYLTAPLSPDNRMRTSYYEAKTGRLRSRSNPFGHGTNLQNQPKRFRQLYLAEEGQVFLEPDLSQAEALDMVYQMGAESLKARMLAGEKIHAVVAEWVDGKKISELTSDRYRDIKSTVHGSNYRMGVNKFATVLKKPVAEAKLLRDKYYSVVPELPTYHAWVEQDLNDTRVIINAYGRRRVFTGRIDDEALRSAYAQRPQSDVADTLNIGMLGLWLIKPADIYLAAQIHDAVLTSLAPSRVEWFKPYIKAHLETLREVEIKGEIMVIPVDIGETKENWYGK